MRESRRRTRLAVQETVNLLVHGEKNKAVVLDLSWGGLRLETEAELSPGSRVAVSPCRSSLGRAKLPCAVRWVGGGQAGLSFIRPVSRLRKCWVNKLLEEEIGERRAAVRVRTELPVEIQAGKGRQLSGRTLDISQGGALLALPDPLQKGKKLTVFLCLPWSLVETGARVLETRGQDGETLCAVRFTGLDERHQEALEAFVSHAVTA